MKNRMKLTLIVFSLLSAQIHAQEKKTLGLNEAIDLSIQNSKQLKNSQAKIDEAMAALKESKEKKLPNASVSGSYLRLNSANIDVKNKDNNGGTPANPSPSSKPLVVESVGVVGVVDSVGVLDVVVSVGASPAATLQSFADAVGESALAPLPVDVGAGEAIAWWRRRSDPPFRASPKFTGSSGASAEALRTEAIRPLQSKSK